MQGAINQISGLSTAASGATHKFTDMALVQQYANSLKGLNLQQAQLALSTKLLSDEQKEQILVQAGLKASEDAIQAELLQTTLEQKGLSVEKQRAILIELGLMDATTFELFAEKTCTKEKLKGKLAQELKNKTDERGILTTLGLGEANLFTAETFKLMGAQIGKAALAMGKWLVTTPVGWIALIFALAKAVDVFTESAEEAGEAATDAKEKYNELQSEIDSLNSKIEENKKLIDETNGASEYDGYRKRLEAENVELERQIGLAKIKAQIENEEADKKAKKALNSEDYTYNPQEWTSGSGNSSTTTYDKGDIATATDWYLDQAEATGVVDDKLEDYIETIKEQRENLNLLNPESKELYDNLGLLIDRYIALYPNVKVTSDEMADSSGNVDKMNISLCNIQHLTYINITT